MGHPRRKGIAANQVQRDKEKPWAVAIMLRATASAVLMPSIAAERIPPA